MNNNYNFSKTYRRPYRTAQSGQYHLAVCEDDPLIRDEICRVCDSILAEETIPHKITPFSDIEELEDRLQTAGQEFDLLILDIMMHDKTGLDFAMELRERNDRVSIIFVTGYDKYLAQGYEVQPVHYLLKPLDPERLKKAVMTDWKLNHRPRTIFLEKGRRNVGLQLHTILYAEANGNHGVRICLQDGELDFPSGLSELAQTLPAEQFVRCHNSYLINLEHVREVNRSDLRMDTGLTLPVSRKYSTTCRDAFLAYINRE